MDAQRSEVRFIALPGHFGYRTAGCYGADPALLQTPAIDRLAREGRRFTDANTIPQEAARSRGSAEERFQR